MSDWNPVKNPPASKGLYLVVQATGNDKFRWVRPWDGEEWCDTKPHIYGDVTHWCELPGFPPLVSE